MSCSKTIPRRTRPDTFALILLLGAFSLESFAVGEARPAAVHWIPEDAVVSLEVRQPEALLRLLTGEKATAAVAALPAYQRRVSEPKFKEFLNLIHFLELTLETDWRNGLAKLAGGGITLAICPEDTLLLIVESEDQQMLEELHSVFLNIARSEAEKEGQAGRVASTPYGDITAWTFDGKEAHAIIGKRLVLSNRPEGLKAMLELRADSERASLASNRAYRAAKHAAGSDSAVRAFINPEPLLHVPDIAGLLDQQRVNPLAALVFAGIVEAIRSSDWVSLGLNAAGESLTLRVSLDGTASDETGPAAFALPGEPGEGALRNLRVPRRIAGMSLYRDLHGFYAAKDELFPERTSGLIFFENMMGIFFSGRDLTEEVMAQTRPEIRLVVAEQEYDPEVGVPQVELPAFAAVFRLHNPQQFDAVVEEAWQKAVGLVNFTRGQQALPGLIIERPVQGQTRFTMAYFSSLEVQDRAKLEQRFNFRPALAMPHDYLILSSTDGLARDLIDALTGETEPAVKPLAGTHSLVEIDGGQFASILQANRATLVRGDMVKKGRTQEQAEDAIDMLVSLVQSVKQVKLSISTDQSLTQALLELKLNLQ